MNEKLIYSVAGHLFSIETPDRRVTSKIMSNYEPFYGENNERDDFLFHLKGGEKVDIPEIPSASIIVEIFTAETKKIIAKVDYNYISNT